MNRAVFVGSRPPEHHAAARRAGNARCASAATAPPVLGRHAATVCVLRSAARSPKHVIASATALGALMAPDRTLTASRGLHESAQPWARTTLARAPSPKISLRESDPATPAERVLSHCFLLARNDPLSHVGVKAGPTRGHRSRRSRACCVGQGCLVGSTPGPSACSAAVRERRRSREEGWGTLPEYVVYCRWGRKQARRPLAGSPQLTRGASAFLDCIRCWYRPRAVRQIRRPGWALAGRCDRPLVQGDVTVRWFAADDSVVCSVAPLARFA